MLDEFAIYASINAIALPCHIEAVDQAANKATLKLVQSNAEAKQDNAQRPQYGPCQLRRFAGQGAVLRQRRQVLGRPRQVREIIGRE